jgi:subtilisin family serine protease
MGRRSRCVWSILFRVAAFVVILSPLSAATPDSPPGEPYSSRPLEVLGVQSWHAAGQRGKGVKVAVLDTGFSGYRKFLGNVLPAQVEVRSFREDRNLEARASQHGILCAEVVHALAPDAELFFANWEQDRPEQFLDAVRWARSRGARVISCSVITPAWSDYEGHGPIHARLREALGDAGRSGGVLFFACAGNTAQRHWAGEFRDDGRGWHAWDFEGISVRDNVIRPWRGERVSVEVSYQRGTYEVVVTDPATGQVVGSELGPPAPGDNPLPQAVVAFDPVAGRRYAVRVRRHDPRSGPFHLVVLGGGLDISSRRGSIPFPGDGAEVVTVGAVDGGGARCAYSSCGDDEDGGKPDLVAPVPFPSAWRGRPFAGTSAAAPQAAGLAALVWSRHLDWPAREVRDSLRSDALHMARPEARWETGAGCLHLSDITQGSRR